MYIKNNKLFYTPGAYKLFKPLMSLKDFMHLLVTFKTANCLHQNRDYLRSRNSNNAAKCTVAKTQGCTSQGSCNQHELTHIFITRQSAESNGVLNGVNNAKKKIKKKLYIFSLRQQFVIFNKSETTKTHQCDFFSFNCHVCKFSDIKPHRFNTSSLAEVIWPFVSLPPARR